MSIEKIEGTDGFDFELTYLQNGSKYLCLDVRNWFNEKMLKYPGYQGELFVQLETFDFTIKILEANLKSVSPPALTGLEANSERAAIRLDHWARNPKYGLAIYTAMKGGFWTRAGLMPIQNLGTENWQPLLNPILTVTSDIFLLGQNSKIAVEFIDMGNGLPKQGDLFVFRGTFSYKISLVEKFPVVITGRRHLGINLQDGIITEILSYNKFRKYLYLTNAGDTNVQFIFGTVSDLSLGAIEVDGRVTQTNGLLLTPGGSFSLDSRYAEHSPLAAVSIGGNGRITLMEGN